MFKSTQQKKLNNDFSCDLKIPNEEREITKELMTEESDFVQIDLSDLDKMMKWGEKFTEIKNKAERKSRENFAKTIAKRTNDIVGQFSNTDKPLSSLTDHLHQLSKGRG